MEPLEEICATRRMMTAVRVAWESSGGTLSLNGLGRAISSDDLKKYATFAKKYVAGMKAQERETGINAVDTVAEFASGAGDGYLSQTRDESMSAYWPWVLAGVEKKRALAEHGGGIRGEANSGKHGARGGTTAVRCRATHSGRVWCRRAAARPPGGKHAKASRGRQESSRSELASVFLCICACRKREHASRDGDLAGEGRPRCCGGRLAGEVVGADGLRRRARE